ncbi:7428_t:CDS:2, partial [Acaulospora colombiana]
MGSPIDLTYIYKLSIVKIKSIGSSNNQTTIRKDTNTLRKLVLINTFIERKMASYEEMLLAKRNSANMNIGCGKIANNHVGVGGNGVRVKLINVTRPNAVAVGNGIYTNPAATVSSNDLGDYEALDEYERPVSPPPPYSPPSSPVYQHSEYPSKHEFGQILIPLQLHRDGFHAAEQTHYQQYYQSQRGYSNQSQPQKAVQKILIPFPVSPKQNIQLVNIPPPRWLTTVTIEREIQMDQGSKLMFSNE